MIQDFVNLVYPNLCCICKEHNNISGTEWCLSCDLKLPKTEIGEASTNVVEQALNGQWPLNFAFASFYFKKGNAIQSLLHELKYKGNKDIGKLLGEKMARNILVSRNSIPIDVVLPVPLHPSKLLTRGYNQAEVIAQVIADKLKCSLSTDNLKRNFATQSQTKKSRYTRWQNTEFVFGLDNPVEFKDQHVLLVDDVFTTGATIGGCLNLLTKIKGIKMSVATLAVADY